MEKEMPCLSNDLGSKEVISFHVLLKLVNLLNVLKIILSTQMGTCKLGFFLHTFCKTSCLWFGVYWLVMEAVTGCARSICWAGISTKKKSCCEGVQAYEAQKLQPWGRGTGSEMDQLPLLKAEISNMNQEKNGFCASKYNKALKKHPWRVETGKVMIK